MPSRMALPAVGAFGSGRLSFLVFIDADFSAVTFTANSTFCRGFAGFFVMPILLAVEASQRFRIVGLCREPAPDSQVNLLRDLANEGA